MGGQFPPNSPTPPSALPRFVEKAEGMHIDGSWFQDLARVKSRLGDCYISFLHT
jgi:hypothetical protein